MKMFGAKRASRRDALIIARHFSAGILMPGISVRPVGTAEKIFSKNSIVPTVVRENQELRREAPADNSPERQLGVGVVS